MPHNRWQGRLIDGAQGSAWDPVIPPVFKTGGRPFRATVCSTHTRFRQIYFGGK